MQRKHRMPFHFLFLFFLLLIESPISLATDLKKDKSTHDKATVTPNEGLYYHRPHQYIAVKLGTLGLGLNYAYTLNKLSGVRFGVNYIGIGADRETTLGVADFNVKYTVQNLTVEAYYEYFPYHKKRGRLSNFTRNFKFVVGVTYFAYANYQARAYRKDGISINGATYTPDDIGEVQASVKTNSIAPYLGISSAWNVPNRRRAKYQIGFDFGLIYQGQPRVDLIGTNFLEGNEEQYAQLEKNLSAFQIFPNLSVKLVYRLH